MAKAHQLMIEWRLFFFMEPNASNPLKRDPKLRGTNESEA